MMTGSDWWAVIAAASASAVAGLGLGWCLWRRSADASAEHLRALVEATPDIVCTAHADHRLAYLNVAGRELTGIGTQSLAGRTLEQLHPPWAIERILNEGLPAALRDGRWTGETALLDAQGRERPMSQTLACHRAADGSVRCLSTLLRDIGAHKRAQAELESSEERLRQAVRVARFGVFEHDHRTDTLYCSPEYRALHGFGPDETVTMDMLAAHVHPDDREKVAAAIARTNDPAGDGKLDLQIRMRTRQGVERWVESRAQALFEGEGAERRPLRIIGAVSDVTERRLAEEQIRRLNAELEQRVRERTAELESTVRELEAFSYSVSHDLRAPLRGIEGFARVLAENSADRLDATGRDYLSRVRRNAARMNQLIDDLLKLAKVSSGKLSPRPCDLSQLSESVARALREAHPASPARVTVQPGMSVAADLGLLKVTMDNLIGNAWKYSALQAQPLIEVGRVVVEGESRYFVRDNGVGFDMAQATRLFNVFERLHSAQPFEGTGIGLATVRRIVDRHGGRVWAESSPGEGACFYFTLSSLHLPPPATLGARRNTGIGEQAQPEKV